MNRFFNDVAPRRAIGPRGAILGGLALALLVLPGIAGCQMPPSNSAAVNDVSDRLREMATKGELAATVDTLTKAHNDWCLRLSQMDTRVGQLGTRVDQEISARLDKLETGLKDTNQRLAAGENSAAIGNNVVDWRLRTLEEHGHQPTYQAAGYTPPEAPSLPPPPPAQPDSANWGVVKIENNMTTWQQVEVNGFPYGVAPLRTVSVIVPAGRATTRLVGFEGTKSWWVGSPDYAQRVVIAPKPAYDSVVRYP